MRLIESLPQGGFAVILLAVACLLADSAYCETTGTASSPAQETAGLAAAPRLLATYRGASYTTDELSVSLQLRRPKRFQGLNAQQIMDLPADKLREVVRDMVYELVLFEKAKEEGITEESPGIKEKLDQYKSDVFNRLYYEDVVESKLNKSTGELLRESYERDKATLYTVPAVLLVREIFLSAYKPYKVAPGDTLESIAQRESGDAAAAPRILRDNPLHFSRRSPGVERGRVAFQDVKPGEQLLVPRKKDELTSQELLAKSLHKKLVAGEDFEALAKAHTESTLQDANAPFTPEMDLILPETRKAIDRTPETSISQVVSSPHGFHLFKVVDRSETRTLTFEEAKPSIKVDEDLRRKSVEDLRKGIVDGLREKHGIEINTDALKREDYQGTDPLTAITWIVRDRDFTYTLDDYRREMVPMMKSWRGMTYQERVDFAKSSPTVVKHVVKRESEQLGLQKNPLYDSEMKSKAVIEVTSEYMRRHEKDRKEPAEAEFREFYNSHLDRFTGVKRVTVREITKRVNLALPDDQRKQAIEDAKKELNTIRGKVRDLSDFEQLARRESAAISSRSRGGLLGTVSIEFRGELFKNQLLQLKPGEVSEPFLYGAEVVIVRLDEVIPAEVQSFEEALPRVRQQYRREVMPKLADEERDRVLQEAGFELKI